jgi:4'-phosphopantetheinyl transferase
MITRLYNLNKLKLDLDENEVHIWNFDLNKFLPIKDHLINILSVDEIIRANKFHFERDKYWFICSRALLRIFTNIYSEIPAKEIDFTFNKFGKPSLSPKHNNAELHFNLSHSKNFMSVGFVQNSMIGLDLELVKPLKDHLEIAKKFFSTSEFEQLISFPTEKLLQGFYSCWTAKESVIKLSGEGLSYPLKEFDVELKDLNIGESYRYNVNLKKQPGKLFLEVFRLQEDLFGACAVNKDNLKIIHYYFNDKFSLNELL